MSTAAVHRFSAGLSGTLFLVSIGLLYGRASVLVLAVVPLGYVAYGALSAAPEPTLSVKRTLSVHTATPGDEVTVDLTVVNDGPRTLPDVRVVDGVPESLVVADGSPRVCCSLRSGESATLSYAVVATRGEYDFADPTVRCRSLSASKVVTTTVPADGERSLTCSATVEQPPVDRATQTRSGTLPTDSGGEGLAFHSTREYRHGDPTSRIDWRRLAKTDELSTVNFREEHAPRLVVLVDARPETRVAPRAGYPSGAELSGYAAHRAYETLSAAGHSVGAAALGLDDVDIEGHDGEGIPWVAAEGKDSSVASARTLFEGVAAAGEAGGASADGPDGTLLIDTGDDLATDVLTRLPPDAEVLFCTPLTDDRAVGVARTLRARDVSVTVLSPDVTAAVEDVGGRVVAQHRADRIAALQSGGVRTVDWPPSAALDAAIGRLIER